MKRDNFTNFTDSFEFFHLFSVRKSILDALRKNIDHFNGTHLDLGCGIMPYKDLIMANGKVKKYIGLDLEEDGLHKDHYAADIYWDGKKIPLPDGSIDSVHATEVFEHCPDVGGVFREIHRILAPDGALFFTVPFLWPLHEIPNDYYRYTPFALERHLKDAGFGSIKLEALGGWDASLAQMISIWIFGSHRSYRVKKALFLILRPFVRYLLRRDRKPDFYEGPMITGISGLAKKR